MYYRYFGKNKNVFLTTYVHSNIGDYESYHIFKEGERGY